MLIFQGKRALDHSQLQALGSWRTRLKFTMYAPRSVSLYQLLWVDNKTLDSVHEREKRNKVLSATEKA